ncbi:septal ring lytic transglycosylase RlpA family protein [Pseudohaliea rubra]|uniref:Endolytic peptidoglycan transglycosylase RlpA n=1 Tax=Pseudohaliea rubra DSM 19751 TaxID=1265313 RepID=A0A095VM77_9GAMM|nr:septal ring lytic transglycosylase RlpA family protein [Pseudohaliea rubra]KGE02562.1 Rare lipoprotein A precursor [Pseudohaliea rubra DSM 19751]
MSPPWSLGCLLLIGLSACSAPEPPDGPPLKAIAAHEVPDSVPRAEPILRAGNSSPYEVAGETYRVLPSAEGYRAEGIASWYGTRFHGRKTANGEPYDLYGPTAAHRTLPIPSYVRVTSLSNGRSMVVRVNDRGPFHPERVIDLSYGAAVRLGFAEAGTARVQLEALTVAGVDDRRRSEAGVYRYLQLGAFDSAATAQSLRDRVATLVDAPVTVTPVEVHGRALSRVRVGPVRDEAHLEAVRAALRAGGLEPGQALP